MPVAARVDLETVLRTKGLDRTLISTSPESPGDPSAVAPTDVPALDGLLGGGFPRGHVSEIVGRLTSGRTTLMLQTLAAATKRGELVALVDASDGLDVTSAAAATVDLDRLLWVRGHVTRHPGACRDTHTRALEQAIRAVTLVLQSRVCELVVLDIADVQPAAIRRLPFTTWLRLHRIIEGSRVACLLVSAAPIWRSAAGMTVQVTAHTWSGATSPNAPSHAHVFPGLTTTARVVRARTASHEPLCVSVSATVA